MRLRCASQTHLCLPFTGFRLLLTDDLWLPMPLRLRYRRCEILPAEAAGVVDAVTAAEEGGGRPCAPPVLRLRCCSGRRNSSSDDIAAAAAVGWGLAVTCTLLGACRASNPVWCVTKFCIGEDMDMVRVGLILTPIYNLIFLKNCIGRNLIISFGACSVMSTLPHEMQIIP